MNRVDLVGRLTRDPELRYTPLTNRPVASFTLAVNRNFTNANGEREADFLNVVVWDKQAENLSKYQKKGSLISVEGRLQTRNYDDKDGKKVYATEVVANNISYLESKKDDGNNMNSLENSLPSGSVKTDVIDALPMENDPFASFGQATEVHITDDMLPF